MSAGTPSARPSSTSGSSCMHKRKRAAAARRDGGEGCSGAGGGAVRLWAGPRRNCVDASGDGRRRRQSVVGRDAAMRNGRRECEATHEPGRTGGCGRVGLRERLPSVTTVHPEDVTSVSAQVVRPDRNEMRRRADGSVRASGPCDDACRCNRVKPRAAGRPIRAATGRRPVKPPRDRTVIATTAPRPPRPPQPR